MILSFGGLKFSHDHLEFNTHPRDLHRDYFFRRISYGNNTHVNITVVLGEDNKAVLYAVLDRNDKPYYACDAGCIDPPVKLGWVTDLFCVCVYVGMLWQMNWQQFSLSPFRREPNKFPVKLTEPLTAVLYITPDTVHMQELKHAIHVKEIAEGNLLCEILCLACWRTGQTLHLIREKFLRLI